MTAARALRELALASDREPKRPTRLEGLLGSQFDIQYQHGGNVRRLSQTDVHSPLPPAGSRLMMLPAFRTDESGARNRGPGFEPAQFKLRIRWVVQPNRS